MQVGFGFFFSKVGSRFFSLIGSGSDLVERLDAVRALISWNRPTPAYLNSERGREGERETERERERKRD